MVNSIFSTSINNKTISIVVDDNHKITLEVLINNNKEIYDLQNGLVDDISNMTNHIIEEIIPKNKKGSIKCSNPEEEWYFYLGNKEVNNFTFTILINNKKLELELNNNETIDVIEIFKRAFKTL